ncbi:tellurium resistance protein [uncultured Lentibacter sp.]|uniref:SLAC1 family transporter n=1 Tax=uncultured Lentibacter sp. TaxID=1659309 RepID=UPI00263824B9|nr:tellurium resistance protein [uncultured Lentibacter sp.]
MRSRSAFGEQTPPAIFTIILGLFGLTMAWRAAAQGSVMPVQISEVLLGAVALLYGFALLAYGRKAVRRLGAVVEDARILPGRGGLAALAVSAAALSAGLAPLMPALAEKLMWLALGAQAVMALLVAYVLLSGPAEQRQVTPLWHLSFVGFIVAAVPAVQLGHTGLAQAIFWGTLAMALVIWALSAVQLVLRVPPLALRPLLAIHLAPASLFTIVALGFPQEGYPEMQLMARIFSGLAVVILVAVLVSLRPVLAAGFSPLWGAYTFPLSAFATAMLSFSNSTGAPLERVLGGMALAAASAIVPYIALKAIRMWMSGQLALKTNAAKA